MSCLFVRGCVYEANKLNLTANLSPESPLPLLIPQQNNARDDAATSIATISMAKILV